MKKFIFMLGIAVLISAGSCNQEESISEIIDESLSSSVCQYALMTDVLRDMPDQLPRTLDGEGRLITVKSDWWTSGFFREAFGIFMSLPGIPGLKMTL